MWRKLVIVKLQSNNYCTIAVEPERVVDNNILNLMI